MRNPIEVLQNTFRIDTSTAEDLLLITHSVDQKIAIRRFGYPKDNLIPESMEKRLADPEYLRLLLESVDDEVGRDTAMYRAVWRYFENSFGG